MTAITAVERDPKKDFFAHAPVRPRCPFYGFVGMAGMLVDNHGNGCGVAGGHRPCAMETAHETPDWNECGRFNYSENRRYIEQALDRCKIFPEELKPNGSISWEGVSLRGWYQLIMRE